MLQYNELKAKIVEISSTPVPGEVLSVALNSTEDHAFVILRDLTETHLAMYAIGATDDSCELREVWRMAVPRGCVTVLCHPADPRLYLRAEHALYQCHLADDHTEQPEAPMEVYKCSSEISSATWAPTIPDHIYITCGDKVLTYSLSKGQITQEGTVPQCRPLAVVQRPGDPTRLYSTGTDGALTLWGVPAVGDLDPTPHALGLPHFGTTLAVNSLYNTLLVVGGAFSSSLVVVDVADAVTKVALLPLPVPDDVGVETLQWSPIDPLVCAALTSDGTFVAGRLPGSVQEKMNRQE